MMTSQQSYQPWHLKYRPQNLSELVGQPLIVRTLTNELKTGNLPNVFLFDGQRGTGKTSTARILAKSLNCLSSSQPTLTPCGICLSCRSICSGSNLDVRELDAASNNGVDDIRELINYSKLSTTNRYRIIYLDECQMLSRSAQNAALKLFEDRLPNTIFILATTESEKLLDTIISRCQHFQFRRLSTQDIIERLSQITLNEKISANPEALRLIAQHSQGGMRDSVQLLEQLAMSTKGKIEPHHVRDVIGSISADSLVDLCVSIFQDTPQRLHNLMVLSNQLNDEGVEPVHLVRELLAIHRDLLVFQLSQDTNSLKQGKVPFASLIDLSSIESLSQLVSIPEIHHRLLTLEAAALSVQQSSNPLIGLEICLLQLAYPYLGKE